MTYDDDETRWILLRYAGEVSIKSPKTKQRFTKRLSQNVRNALGTTGARYRIEREWHRMLVESAPPLALDSLPQVSGLQSVTPIRRVAWRDMAGLVGQAEAAFAQAVRGKRFAVRARRAGKTQLIPFRSADLQCALGTALLEHASRVDLSTPEVTVYLEVYPEQAYLFTEMVPAEGGLPVGVQGRALSLVSGGFDSAVASWMLLRRGVSLDYLFCNLGGIAHRRGVLRVMKVLADLWSYGERPHLYEVDFQPVVEEIQAKVLPKYWQVVLKRLMLRAGERLARELELEALVTGDSVGQVSSQTLQNMAVVSRATQLALLRPLVGMNKEEIIALARRIGTYERSAEVEEYCGLAPANPSTKASFPTVEVEEGRLYPSLRDRVFASRIVHELRAIELEEAPSSDVEVEAIPEGTVAVDLRSRAAYEAWHAPDALHLDYARALTAYPAFGREQSYVLYCEVGFKSAYLAELMRKSGFRACHVAGGVRTLLARAPAGHVDFLL